MTTYTSNKSLQVPATNSSSWDVPLNANWDAIDAAFGTEALISVTGVTGTTALTLAQYQCLCLDFGGTLTANVIYSLPSGVGGIWVVRNTTTGAYTLTLINPGGSIPINQGQTALLYASQYGALINADTQYVNQIATSTLASANTTAQGYATTAQTNAETFAAIASNLTSGTVNNARLNNIGIGPGVTIQSNPGTVPSGSAGQMWLYY